MRKWNVKFSYQYGYHLPVLINVVKMTKGSVLEMGSGIYSTPVLHWLTSPCQRELVTIDNDDKYIDMYQLRDYEDDYHKVVTVQDWDQADIERPWDVAFIDHKPAERRRFDIARLAEWATYIVVHDTHERRKYEWEQVFPLFTYQKQVMIGKRGTTVLSNFREVRWIGLC